MRTGETRVSRVLEAMPAGFYSLDRDWRFTHVNAEAERLLGSRRDDLLGRVVWEAFPGALDSIFEENLATAVRDRPARSRSTPTTPRPSTAWFEVRAWPSPDGLSVYFLDVTERRRVQVQAEQSARRLADPRAGQRRPRRHPRPPGRDRAGCPALVVPGLADFAIATLVDARRPARATSVRGTPIPPLRPLLERYAEVRIDALPGHSPVARALRHRRGGRAPRAPTWAS